MVCWHLFQCMTHSAATSLKNNDRMFAALLVSSTSVPNSCFQWKCKVWNGHGFLGLYPLLLGSLCASPEMTCKAWASHSKPPTTQNSWEGSLPGLPNLLGSTLNILITPPTCFYTEFLEMGWVPSWDEINSQFLHKTEHYSLPGSEKLIVGELVQPSHSSPAACAKGRVLWGVFTQCTPEPLPARRLAR